MLCLGPSKTLSRTLRRIGVAACLAWLTALAPAPTFGCGADTDCMLGDRSYRVRMPEGHDGESPVAAILYVHGFRGSAAAVMNNQALGDAVAGLGLALIAPSSRRIDWAMDGSPITGDDEIVYFTALLDDVTRRFPIDPDRIMAAGFSSGGMMVWSLACDLGDRFVGFAPVSGTFWEPMPESCPSPPSNLFHVHGTTDGMVPLEGRLLDVGSNPHNDRSARQGNVRRAIAMYAAQGDFGPAERYRDGDLDCERQTNPDGLVLELCLHPDGHRFDPAYYVRAWIALVELGAVP